MKNKSPWAAGSAIKRLAISAALASALVASPAILAPTAAWATIELDRQYALESIGFLRPWDNVDGLFADAVSDAYREYFRAKSRFKLQDLDPASRVLVTAQLPYSRLIEDTDVLGQIARSMRVETVLRTKIFKEGPRYRFTLQWMLAPKMELLADEQFYLDDAGEGKALAMGDLKGRLHAALENLVKKVPFVGMVNGRDGDNVTLNIGARDGIQRGDRVTVGTLDDVKRHPLLKTVVEWSLTPTGKIEIDDTDEALAFGHVVEEREGRSVSRYQKVMQVVPAPESKKTAYVETPEEKRAAEYAEPPRLGWGGADVWFGMASRDYSVGTESRQGGGLFIGADGRGDLWFTRNWFGSLAVGYGSSGFSPTREDDSEVVGAGNMSFFQYELSGGYTYYASPSLFGPKAWVRFGFHSHKFSMKADAAEFQSPLSFTGFFLGIGGELPVRDRYGAALNLDFGLINSASQSVASLGTLSGANDVRFYLGGYYRWLDRVTIRAGLNVLVNSADIGSTGSVTQRIITIGPSVLYYF